MYQFGMRLPLGEEGTVGAGLGPPQRPGPRSFVAPTRTFESAFEGETGGVRYQIHLIPSETEDQCAVWLPDEKVLLSADAVYESFPNIYALRGTRFRNPMTWAKGIDRLREFGAEILVPHHGRPVEGAAEIAALLTDYRDAIQYVHDQTIRYMNKGYTPDEISEIVVMPERLRDHPWLGEYYGSYKHAIPAIYAGYLGWYQGDPAELDPAARRERARRYVALMGGREKVLKTAEEALENGDPQWAAELSGLPVRADPEDREARSLKASALREWGYAQKNATWRNWGLTAAMELDGTLETTSGGMVLGSPEQVRGFSLDAIMQVLTVRLIAERSWDTRLRVAFQATDSGESCALEIRRGVCQFFADPPGDSDAEVRFDRTFLVDWVFGRTAFEDAVESGEVAVEGDVPAVADFLAKFEPLQPSWRDRHRGALNRSSHGRRGVSGGRRPVPRIEFSGLPVKLIGFGIALAAVYTAAFGVIDEIYQRSITVGASVILVTLAVPLVRIHPSARGAARAALLAIDAALIGLMALSLYWFASVYDELESGLYDFLLDDILVGAGGLLALLELTRRAFGWPLAVLSLLCLAYALFGEDLPWIFAHAGYDLEQVMRTVWYSFDGVFGFIVITVISLIFTSSSARCSRPPAPAPSCCASRSASPAASGAVRPMRRSPPAASSAPSPAASPPTWSGPACSPFR